MVKTNHTISPYQSDLVVQLVESGDLWEVLGELWEGLGGGSGTALVKIIPKVQLGVTVSKRPRWSERPTLKIVKHVCNISY